MLRTGLKTLAVLMALGVFAHEANAFHHRHRGWGGWGSGGGYYGGSSGGYYGGGSWGSSGGYYSGYSGWGSSGGRWGGSSGGGGWGSSGGGYYYGGSSGGWSGGSSGGSSGGYYGGSSGGSSGGAYKAIAPADAAPVVPSAPATPPTPPAPTDGSTTFHPTYGPLRSSAMLTVKVPADAKVFVNDKPTTSTGAERDYISRDLQPGAQYSYKVRAEFDRDGKTVTEEKTVQLTAGQNQALDFTGAQQVQTANSTDTRTTLIIRLPADAKLFLAGKEMKAQGEVREFSTNKLPAGAQWQTYAIRAVVNQNGHDEVREQTVSLKAGETRELSINFDAPQVADASAR